MNKNIKAIRKVVLDYNTKIEQRAAMSANLKQQYDMGNISKNSYDERVADLNNATQDKDNALQAIQKASDEYEQELNKWAVLNAKDLTDDLKLFNSPLNFEPFDYQGLETKYQCNYSMLKAIKDHARKNDVTYESKYSINKTDKVDQMNSVATAAKGIIASISANNSMNYNVAMWAKEEAFNKLYNETSTFVQTNEGSRKLINSDGTISWA